MRIHAGTSDGCIRLGNGPNIGEKWPEISRKKSGKGERTVQFFKGDSRGSDMKWGNWRSSRTGGVGELQEGPLNARR